MHSQCGRSPSGGPDAKARLRWQCRRGMKELEGLLVPFFEGFFDELTEGDQQSFARLLAAEDADLYAWFLGYAVPSDAAIRDMLAFIQTQLKLGAIEPEV